MRSGCTYLKLCGSINDASWEDEERIVQGVNRSMKRREVSRETEERIQHGILVIFLLIGPLQVLSSPKSHMCTSNLQVEEEPALNEGVFTVWRDPNTIDVYTAIFQTHKRYTAAQVVLRNGQCYGSVGTKLQSDSSEPKLGGGCSTLQSYSRSEKPCQ